MLPTRLLSVARSIGLRLAEATFVLVLLASLVFLAMRILPGDPATLVLGDQATPAELAELRARLQLDQPLGLQYVGFLRGLAELDLGESLRKPGTKAMSRVLTALGPTSELAFVAVGMGAILGTGVALLGAGPWLGERRRWVDRLLLLLAALPLLAFAPLATFALAVRAHVVPLPGDPDSGLAGLAFASLLLALPLGAQVGRVGRAALEDVARSPFLTVAAAKGAPSVRVWFLHALPVAAGPIIVTVASELGALLGGAVILERLFERVGLGTLIIESYASRDLPVLEGAVVAAGAIFVAVQGFAAAAHALVDPRVRENRERGGTG